MGSLLVSALLAFMLTRLYDYGRDSLEGAASGVARAARPGVFVGVWTTVTTALGMRAFSERIKRWRHGIGGKE